MEKLEGHNFTLKKGDYLLFKKRDINFDSFTKSYIGIVRNYDGVSSKAGVLSKPYVYYHLSGEIREVNDFRCFAWYKKGFIILTDFETGRASPRFDDVVDVYKMDKKEIAEFKGRITKLKILKKL